MKIKKTKVTNAFINPAFSAGDLISGQEDYHGQNPPANKETCSRSRDHFRLGVELEVCFYDEDKADEFRATPRNWYEMEHDGSLSKGQTQGEVITLPLRTEDACNTEFWRPLCNALTRATGFSWDAGCCGLHVHASQCGLLRSLPEGMNALGKTENLGFNARADYIRAVRDAKKTAMLLYMFMVEDQDEALNVFGRGDGEYRRNISRITCEARNVNTALQTLGAEVLKCQEATQKAKDAMPYAHRCAVNISNQDTIEFRQGRGSLRPERIAAICMFVTLFMRFCQRFDGLKTMTINRGMFLDFARKNCPVSHPLAFFLDAEH